MDVSVWQAEGMWLERHCHLPARYKTVCLGPVPGGRFWALAGLHDLGQALSPWDRLARRQVTPAMFLRFRVWVSRIPDRPDTPCTWQEVLCPEDLLAWVQATDPTTTWWEDYDACSSGIALHNPVQVYCLRR